jgi:CheY-like chemotaxis protein
MQHFNLERISVLLVDDSNFMLSLLTNVFTTLGTRRIHRAHDGQDAIKLLKSTYGTSSKAVGTSLIDLIIADYYMEPIDGLMLLRWIRRSNDSPDRFVPFIMISAAADRSLVAATRDAGVSEFIAKPFSVNSILTKLSNLIERPRPFVFCSSYFGPDRRRRDLAFGNENRRKIAEHEIETVYAGRVPKPAANRTIKVWRYELPNVLRRKVGVAADTEPATIDPNLIAAAEAQIKEMEDDYADWVRRSIERLVLAHQRATEAPQEAAPHYQTINKIAHELRGQGGIFGYPLISRFAFSLYACTDGAPEIDEKHLDLVKAHIDGIRVVMKDKVSGDGGPIGRELLAGLDKAKEKYQTA